MPMARADAPLRSHRAPVPLLASAVFRPALRHQPAPPERSGAGRERGFPEGASARPSASTPPRYVQRSGAATAGSLRSRPEPKPTTRGSSNPPARIDLAVRFTPDSKAALMAKTDSKTTAPVTDPAAPPPDAYDPQAVEARWQSRWAERRTNEPDLDQAKRPFYNLMMFPYPSAEGLHVGNMFAFTGSDVFGRFKRLQGYDVFEPIGFDAFGIHSENYAIKLGINPGVLIPQNIVNFTRQLRRIGGMFDWRHELSTTDPAYYKWTQWIFLQLLKAGKAYKKSAAVNWCPKDMTVLANEQVINGHCERCDTVVEQRTLEQWFFRITEYAPRLLADLDDKSKMDWSDTTTTAQRNWLGRSEGAELEFPLAGAGIGRRVDPGLHHPGRHHLRRHVHGARARAPAGGPPGLGRPAGQGGRVPQGGRVAGPGLPQGRRAREDRRLHRRLRGQSRHGEADPGLDRRLRADGVRHRRHHGRAGARRPRLRVRGQVRPAHRPGGGAGRSREPDARRPGRRRHRRVRHPPVPRQRDRHAGQLGQVRRPGRPRGQARHRRVARGQGRRQGGRSTSACTTGASPASATGVRRSPSSTATSTAPSRSRSRTCRSSSR